MVRQKYAASSTWLGADRSDLLQALAYSMIPEWPACADDPPIIDVAGHAQPAYQGFVAEAYVLAWLEETAGVPRSDLRETYGDYADNDEPGVLAIVKDVRALSPERQQVWLERNLAAIASCDVQPQIEP